MASSLPSRTSLSVALAVSASTWVGGLVLRADTGLMSPVSLTPVAVVQDDDEAKEALVHKVCNECHPMDRIVAVRRTAREWKDMITTMAGKGANASPAEFATIRAYLTRWYGVVPVNTAPAADLAAVLGVSDKVAAAIVEFRTAHGKFADLDALAKVPGLDVKELAEDPDALLFD